MTLRTRLPLLALALASPALAQPVQDFQLPAAPAPSPTPRVQGPVDEGAPPLPARPAPIRAPVPEPTPTVTIPAPEPTSTRAITPAATPTPQRRVPARATTPPPEPATTSEPATADPAQATLPPPEPAPTAAPPILTDATPAATPTAPPAATLPAFTPDPRWLAGLAAAMLAVFGAWFWRRRRTSAPPPMIEPPLARPTATPVRPTTVGPALSVQAEAVKLTRSFAFATLDYRLTLTNRGTQAISDLAISADLASAHSNAPVEQQVALPTTELPPRHRVERLAPGQSQHLTGQVQLPIGEAQVIRQGQLPLLVPLLRLRIDGAGDAPLVRTFVIGQAASETGRLQPFRLDEGPRSYSPISQRALDLG